MSLVPLKYPPGVCKVNSPYADSSVGGRYTDMDKTRFVDGYPEGIWNWIAMFTSSNTDTSGSLSVRGVKVFRSNAGTIYIGFGNNSHLYYKTVTAINPTSLTPITCSGTTDITPLRGILTGSLTNPLTTNATTTVSVAHTAHGLITGDYVQLVTGTTVDGIKPIGIFTNIQRTDANNYTFVNTSTATGSTMGGGGTVTYTYYRITLTNPFDTTISTPTVKVHHTAHGAVTGDYVTIASASAIGGITPSGEYLITKVDADSYNITHSSNATSSVSGGGGTPNFLYNIATGDTSGNSLRIWSLDNYGQQLLSSPYNDTIYIWDPVVGGRSYPMYNAPSGVLAMFVTPERFVFALGQTSAAMTVKWADQIDYTIWTAANGNTANSRTLQEGSFLVGGIAVRDKVSLIYSNAGCYTFTYTGDSFIYTDELAGRKCGLPGPLAVTVKEGVGYWYSGAEFWYWNGSVQRLPSDDIRDYVSNDFYTPEQRQTVVGSHVTKNEVWINYASTTDVMGGGNAITSRYIIFSLSQPCWMNGKFHITSWADSGLLPCPIFSAWDGSSGSQMVSIDYGLGGFGNQGIDNGTSFIKASPQDISHGDNHMDVLSFIPDFKIINGPATNGMNLTITTQTYPNDTEVSYGPYAIPDDNSNPRVDARIGAKLIGFKMETTGSAAATQWRLGLPRVEAQAAGGRR